MTRDDILKLAQKHQQYRDCHELTLRGEGIVEFAQELLAKHRDADAARWLTASGFGPNVLIEYELARVRDYVLERSLRPEDIAEIFEVGLAAIRLHNPRIAAATRHGDVVVCEALDRTHIIPTGEASDSDWSAFSEIAER